MLLTGGTDGGNTEVLVRAARELVDSGWTGPVVVAGNVEARDEVSRILGDVPHVLADNVVPADRRAGAGVGAGRDPGGVPDPRDRRQAPEQRTDFTAMVRGATPDVVLTGVELLARGLDEQHPGAGDVVVVDVGGATTDVHSVTEVDPEEGAVDDSGLAREVVAPTPVTRTVEADLGMRWSAVSTVEVTDHPELLAAARTRHDDPGFLPATEAERAEDEAIARAATDLAVRRHAGRSRVVVSPEGRVVERTGTDLREVGLVVGSGGVLRHGRPGVADRVLGGCVGTDARLAAAQVGDGRGRHGLRAGRGRAARGATPAGGVPPGHDAAGPTPLA